MALFLTSVSGSGVQYTLAGTADGIVMPGVVITSDNNAAVALTGAAQALAVMGHLAAMFTVSAWAPP